MGGHVNSKPQKRKTQNVYKSVWFSIFFTFEIKSEPNQKSKKKPLPSPNWFTEHFLPHGLLCWAILMSSVQCRDYIPAFTAHQPTEERKAQANILFRRGTFLLASYFFITVFAPPDHCASLIQSQNPTTSPLEFSIPPHLSTATASISGAEIYLFVPISCSISLPL